MKGKSEGISITFESCELISDRFLKILRAKYVIILQHSPQILGVGIFLLNTQSSCGRVYAD